jgi:valyl-tRNA synthetase
MEKGTGAMMVCSYGDKYDVEAIERHKLTPKIILNQNGTLNLGDYNGMKIKDARKKIIEELKSKNLVAKEEPITHTLNVHDKCGTEIEFLPTEQWFIKILDKKKEFISLGKKIKWHPDYMKKRYENWVSGLDWDWNISRNRHFGIPIPAWECKSCGEIIVPDEIELPIDPISMKRTCPQCKGEAIGETKVLDTWATSSLTPQIASFLSGNKIKIPYSLRPQAHDIIRTWAFYTIVKSHLHEKKLPWNNIMISGFVTLGGEKMSKSKGNVINPNEIIEKYGADALRFWAAGSKLGENLDYREEDVLSGKKFITKLKNASNFVFMNLKDYNGKKPKKLEKDDIEFLGKLNNIIKSVTEYFVDYEYSKAKAEIENFFWKDFCDYYLETVKKVIYQGSGNKKLSAQYTLYRSLLTIIKLIAPIMPFITEKIYQEHFKKTEKEKSIHLCEWPKSGKEKYKGHLEILKNILSRINQFKSDNHLPLNTPLKEAVTPSNIILSGAVLLPSEDYKIINDYSERFLAVSGAYIIKSGKEFKIEEEKK